MLKDIVENGAQDKFQLLCSNRHSIKTFEEVWTKQNACRRKSGDL